MGLEERQWREAGKLGEDGNIYGKERETDGGGLFLLSPVSEWTHSAGRESTAAGLITQSRLQSIVSLIARSQ